MPSHLTEHQHKELSLSLDRLKSSLETLLDTTKSGAEPVKLKDNQGRLSRMDEMHNQSILIANRNLTKNRLREVLAAEFRLHQEHYGICTECDDEILFKRLQAYPETNMCLNCKSLSESQGGN